MATKTALVTGGSAGIGKALALRLAESGLDVLICGRREGPLAAVAAGNNNIRTCVADVATAEGCAALKTALGDKPLHMLVHNAGVNCIGAFDTLSREQFRSTCAVNVDGPLFLTQALTANLKAAGGKARVLIVSSGAGDMALPTMGGYCISKAAVKMAWMVMRDELADVAAVGYCLPGLVESELTEHMLEAEGFALHDFIAGRFKSGDIHTAAEVGEWLEALLDAKKCAADIFKTRQHNVDDKDHQLGVKVRFTMEAGLIEAAKEEAKAKAAPQGKKGKKEEAPAKDKTEDKKAVDPDEAKKKLLKTVKKEGGKRGVEIEGAADMGGLQFFCTSVELPDGDLDLLTLSVEAMNEKSDPTEEERKGGSGAIGKMVFSAGTHQLGVLAYVPEEKLGKDLVCEEWLKKVLSTFNGEIVSVGKSICTGFVKADGDKNIFPLKIREPMILEANNYLRKLGLFPEDDGDSDEMVFGDDDFPSM